VLLVSRKGMSLRFEASDEALRPMGRSTSGVIGMHFRAGDELLSASVADGDGYVFVVTEGGFAKRTAVSQYRLQGRGGLGIKVAKLEDRRGDLAGALIVADDDEVLVVLSGGKVVRSAVGEVPAKGRDTMGVVFARFADDDRIIAIARNGERRIEAEVDAAAGADMGTATTDSDPGDVVGGDGISSDDSSTETRDSGQADDIDADVPAADDEHTEADGAGDDERR